MCICNINCLQRQWADLLGAAGTDILLGYHSEEGWTAAIRMLTRHYGYEVENGPIYVFVAVVPVTLDALFKYWIFKGLNRQSPAAAVTLRNMDRH